MVISFEIGGKEELRVVVEKLKTIDSVIDVERTRG
jgi:uncharacterized protein with ACT and thioredoxin-like domain